MKDVYEEVVADEFERLKPNVVGRLGEMHSRVNMQRSQEVARVAAVMLRAFQQVEPNPKPERALKTP